MTHYLVLYHTEQNKSGATVLQAKDETELNDLLAAELLNVIGQKVKYWYTSVDLAKKKFIYDMKITKVASVKDKG